MLSSNSRLITDTAMVLDINLMYRYIMASVIFRPPDVYVGRPLSFTDELFFYILSFYRSLVLKRHEEVADQTRTAGGSVVAENYFFSQTSCPFLH